MATSSRVSALSRQQTGKASSRLLWLLAISGLALWLIFLLSDFTFEFADVRWSYFGLGFAAFLLNYTFRAARFRILSGSHPPFAGLWSISAAHGVLNYLIPARLGELSLPVMARHIKGFSPSLAVAALVASRGQDILIIVAVALVVLATGLVPLPGEALRIEWLALFLLFGFFLIYALRIGLVRRVLEKMTRRFPRLESAVINTFTRLESMNSRELYVSAIHTVAIWCMIWLNFFCLAHAIGCPLDISGAIAISIILIPLSLLPTQGFANLGTYELAWVLVLVARGAGSQEALGWAVGTHILLTLHVVLLGIVAGVVWLLCTAGVTTGSGPEQ